MIHLCRRAARENFGIEVYTNAYTHEILTFQNQGKGIECVAQVIQHEQHHIDTYNRFHGQGDDPDGDGIPTYAEDSYDGISSRPDDPDTYNLKEVYPSYQFYGDDEIRSRKTSTYSLIPIYPNLDWANPGCQHKNQYGPLVQ